MTLFTVNMPFREENRQLRQLVRRIGFLLVFSVLLNLALAISYAFACGVVK